MKKIVMVLGLMMLLVQSTLAFRPAGWVYSNYPWAYDSGSGDWYWFNTADTQWVANMGSGQWATLPNSALASGWCYYKGNFSYAQENGAWHWINTADTQWVVNMRMGLWSLFCVAPAPAGMALIPGGTNTGTDPDFGAYALTVNTFYMDKYEVTKTLWDEVYTWAVANGYSFDNAGSGKAANHPVHSVSWYDVVKWCNARSEKEGRTPVYYTDAAMTQVYKTGQVTEPYVKTSANGYRLPTDEQWEYAARGGLSGRRFPWGDTITHSQANYYSLDGDSFDISPTREYHPTYAAGDDPYTSPAGAFAPNGYGLYDMAGNVWEWCFDWHPGYDGSLRVVRGGCWDSRANLCQVGDRGGLPGAYWYLIGFRAVLPPGQQ